METAESSVVLEIAKTTQILTAMPDQLTTQNISAAMNISVQILKKPNISDDAQVSFKTVIRCLWLNIWDMDSVPSPPADLAVC